VQCAVVSVEILNTQRWPADIQNRKDESTTGMAKWISQPNSNVTCIFLVNLDAFVINNWSFVVSVLITVSDEVKLLTTFAILDRRKMITAMVKANRYQNCPTA